MWRYPRALPDNTDLSQTIAKIILPSNQICGHIDYECREDVINVIEHLWDILSARQSRCVALGDASHETRLNLLNFISIVLVYKWINFNSIEQVYNLNDEEDDFNSGCESSFIIVPIMIDLCPHCELQKLSEIIKQMDLGHWLVKYDWRNILLGRI